MSIVFDKLKLSQGSFRLSADFTMKTGRKYALLGPSGGGKSTLLSAIAGFKKEDAGRIIYNDRDITDMEPMDRPVSLLFQDHNLFPHLSVAQNIGLGIRPDLKLTETEREVVHGALTRVGLSGLDDKMPAELSGGQQQRVALARVLLRGRPILLLDEPFAALGPALKEEMLALVSEITDAADATLLMVTHQPEDAIAIADEVVIIAEGQAAAPLPTKAIFEAPPEQLSNYLGTTQQIGK